MAHQHTLSDDAYRPRDPHQQATPSGDLHDPHTGGHHAHATHVVPLWFLAAILALLLILTVVTLGSSYVDMGNFNIAIALAIAAAKGSLVVLYFMHLRWDSTFNALAFVSALIFLALFIGISLLDSGQYLPTFESPGGQQITATSGVQSAGTP